MSQAPQVAKPTLAEFLRNWAETHLSRAAYKALGEKDEPEFVFCRRQVSQHLEQALKVGGYLK